jgi:hypothetical protein
VGHGKITTTISRASAADREEMVDIAEAVSQALSKAQLPRLLLQLANNLHQLSGWDIMAG